MSIYPALSLLPRLLVTIPLLILFASCRPNPIAHIEAADAALRQGKYDQVLLETDRALSLDPNSVPAKRLRIKALIGKGEETAALDAYEVLSREKGPDTILLKEICQGFLREGLKQQNFFVRSASVKAMGEMKDYSTVPILAMAMKDGAAFVRFFAVESLGELADPPSLRLLESATQDPEPMVRISAVKALDGIEGDKAVPILAKFSGDGDLTVRLFALAALVHRGDSKAREALTRTVREVNKMQRATAAAALGQTRDRSLIPLLLPLLSDKDSQTRTYAAEALGKIGGPEAFGPLSKALSDPDLGVRGSAAAALGKLGDPRAVPLLTKSLPKISADARVSTRRAAASKEKPTGNDDGRLAEVSVAESLVRLGASPGKIYDEAVSDPDYGVRHFAVGSLGQIGDETSIPLLKTALSDEAPRVRIAAVRAIGEIGRRRGGERVTPLLYGMLRDPDPSVKIYAAGNLGWFLMEKNPPSASTAKQ
ncbi:MAG TPA: HEAT repeat domain-containing protein [Nitrospiria bacterium]|nr:HEAT repeat domain-containing protein [Nitrospiria bacterium]